MSDFDAHECLRVFALEMEAKLHANDHKPGWERDNMGMLRARLIEELEEADEAAKEMMACMHTRGETPDFEATLGEVADAANFLMMLSTRIHAMKLDYEAGKVGRR